MIPQTQINPPSAKIVFQSEARRRAVSRQEGKSWSLGQTQTTSECVQAAR